MLSAGGIMLIRTAFLALLCLLPLSAETELRHEVARIVAIDPEANTLDAIILLPPDYDGLPTTSPGFYARLECKGPGWNPDPLDPNAQIVELGLQWTIYGPNGQLEGPSDLRTVYGRCPQQDRDSIVDLTPAMPRLLRPGARIRLGIWPPPDRSADRDVFWVGVVLQYEAEVSDGKRGPQGPPGVDGAPGRDGRDGQDGKDGRDGVCDCDQCQRKDY